MSCQVCHRLLCQCGFGTQGAYDAELIATLTQQRDELLAQIKVASEIIDNIVSGVTPNDQVLLESLGWMEAAIAKASGDQLPQQEKASD